jgi:hypothetical protein
VSSIGESRIVRDYDSDRGTHGTQIDHCTNFTQRHGFFACVIVIAANGNQTPDAAIHFIRSIQSSIRLFIVGAGRP